MSTQLLRRRTHQNTTWSSSMVGYCQGPACVSSVCMPRGSPTTPGRATQARPLLGATVSLERILLQIQGHKYRHPPRPPTTNGALEACFTCLASLHSEGCGCAVGDSTLRSGSSPVLTEVAALSPKRVNTAGSPSQMRRRAGCKPKSASQSVRQARRRLFRYANEPGGRSARVASLKLGDV